MGSSSAVEQHFLRSGQLSCAALTLRRNAFVRTDQYGVCLSSLMDCLVTPLQEKMEDWKKTCLYMDKEHAKGTYWPLNHSVCGHADV